MKKVALFLSMMLACVFSASALDVAELIGKWESKPVNLPSEDKSIKAQSFLTLDFKEDGTCVTTSDIKMHITDGNGIYVDILMTMTGKGTYVVDGDSINIVDDGNSLETDYDISVRGVEDDQTISQIKSGAEEMANMIIEGLVAEYKKDPNTTITGVVVLGKKMMCTLSDQALTFTRKKK